MRFLPTSRNDMTGCFFKWIITGWLLTATFGVASGGEDRQPDRLAVFVSGATDDSQALQSLLEAEAIHAWPGEIVERKQLDAVLGELQLASAFDAAARTKLGRLLHADYLVVVRHENDQAVCLVNRFPQATVVTEFKIRRSSPDAMAKRIAVRAFREIQLRQRADDQQNLYVSLGSFLCDDPFERYANFCDDLHRRLRNRIPMDPRIIATERFYPSQLLGEFQLNRKGLTRVVASNLSAPPSDVLIVGQFQPSKVQPLDGESVELSFNIRLTSPTGMFPAKNIRFTTDGPDVETAADRINDVFQQLVALPRTKRPRATRQDTEKEFQTLKQQAFRLMPYPPKSDGNFHSNGSYRGSSQVGSKAYPLNRALRAVENAMLFRGDDPQLLVCAGVLMHGLASYLRGMENRNVGGLPPNARERALLATGFDYLENALLLESNENTRGVCYEAVTWRDRPLLPKRVSTMSARIVREGTDAGWFPHQVKWAWIWLARLAPDVNAKLRLVRQAADADVEPDTLFNLLETVDAWILGQPKHAGGTALVNGLADELVGLDSAFHRSMGHYLHARIEYHDDSRARRWLPHIRRAIDLIPACYDEHGAKFIQCSLSYRIFDMMQSLASGPRRNELSRDALELFERYAARQTEIANYQSSSLTRCMSRLLPVMYDQQRFEEALRLLTPLIENHTAGGSADFERMRLARWHDRLRQATASEPRLAKGDIQRIAIPNTDRETRIKKLVFAGDRIWAIRTDYWLRDRVGELFQMPVDASEAKRFVGIDGVVTDIAASSNQLAVATIDQGLYLLDLRTKKIRCLEPSNSTLPSRKVRTVAAVGSRFHVGLPAQGSHHFYELAPDTKTLRDLEWKRSYHSHYSTKYCPAEQRLVIQTWDERTFDDEGRILRMLRKPYKNAIHMTTVTDDTMNVLFKYTGVELNYVYDFVCWQGNLVFATGNGLYVATPKSARLRCVMNDLDTEFFSLRGVGKSLFVGTNKGLYRVSHSQLVRLIAEGRPAAKSLR